MTTDAPHILVVDDDTRLRDLLSRYLSENGFRVTTASDAAEARARLVGLTFDLLVLDVMMPGEDGLTFTASLRSNSRVPILLLTAMGEPEDRIMGLEFGADDYLPKPFEPRELVLRIGNILNRAAPPAPAATIHLGECSFDVGRETLRCSGRPVHLTTVETSLLKTLAASAGLTLSREELIRMSRIDGNDRTVDVQVARLRRKIEPDPRAPRYLHTVRGVGYVLQPD